MNIIDIVIILFILLIGVIGWHNGVIKTTVAAIGILIVFVLSFYLKNPIAEWMSLNLPFFNFWGDFKNVTILNVVIYQLLSFIIVFSILMIFYNIIVKLSSFIEKLLKCTIILGIPSKILGFIVGIIEGQIIIAVILIFLSLPIFGIDLVHKSKLKGFILESTPIVGNLSKNTSIATNEIMELRNKFSSDSTKDEFNKNCLDIMLKYNIIEVDYATKLLNSGKLKIDNYERILNKYR